MTERNIPSNFLSIHNAGMIRSLLLNIHGWGVARNIIGGATPQAQFLKLVEEATEISDCDTVLESLDGLGDTIVVAAMIAGQMGFEAQLVDMVFDLARDDKDEGDCVPYTFPGAGAGENELLPALGELAGRLARNDRENTPRALYKVLDGAFNAYLDLHDYTKPGQEGRSRWETEEFEDLGDIVVYALGMAWDEIKDRKGVVHKGVFIKSTDLLAYGSALSDLGRRQEADDVYAQLRAERGLLPPTGELIP